MPGTAVTSTTASLDFDTRPRVCCADLSQVPEILFEDVKIMANSLHEAMELRGESPTVAQINEFRNLVKSIRPDVEFLGVMNTIGSTPEELLYYEIQSLMHQVFLPKNILCIPRVSGIFGEFTEYPIESNSWTKFQYTGDVYGWTAKIKVINASDKFTYFGASIGFVGNDETIASPNPKTFVNYVNRAFEVNSYPFYFSVLRRLLLMPEIEQQSAQLSGAIISDEALKKGVKDRLYFHSTNQEKDSPITAPDYTYARAVVRPDTYFDFLLRRADNSDSPYTREILAKSVLAVSQLLGAILTSMNERLVSDEAAREALVIGLSQLVRNFEISTRQRQEVFLRQVRWDTANAFLHVINFELKHLTDDDRIVFVQSLLSKDSELNIFAAQQLKNVFQKAHARNFYTESEQKEAISSNNPDDGRDGLKLSDINLTPW